jgi:L-ribulose-5-phosphate 3-epimerase
MNRRQFIQTSGMFAATVSAATLSGCSTTKSCCAKPWFEISLAEWSLHRTIRNQKTITNLDFPKVAKQEFGISAIEYVNQFFMDKARDEAYLKELKGICAGEGVESVLIMCDGEGNLGDPAADRRERRGDQSSQVGGCGEISQLSQHSRECCHGERGQF